MDKTIEQIIDETLDFHSLNSHYKSWSSKDEAKKIILDLIGREVYKTKVETVKKCNNTGIKTKCPICLEPAVYQTTIGGAICIVCNASFPF